MRLNPILFALFSLVHLVARSQSFEATMAKQGLVDVQKVDPTILVDLKYSTTDNFVGKDVYGDLTRAYMQPMAAQKLAEASKYLQAHHPTLRLLVYDAARPRTAQWKLWNALPDLPENERQKYVADPRKGSIHNYGCAVDLTVANQDGKPLDMGTKYDFFGELAYPSRENELLKAGKLTQQQIDNRQILRTAMRQGGFSPIEFEWWHFNALSREKAKMVFRIVD
ncbi:M15 family metallopeptidase [Spirosoma radiotolerans]|uniref:D-alanyl-D-alanine dipeptidase n=1 Tax=Spirosoma radiotolerans TaxID=1379870 RepID=A0A0E3ZYL9_9BACT|nr:M15 family metallopeptidase [Spirosoma radiotolerans]AKD57510.1 peptidase M15 [Spirosoma radiotolerans]